jgi:hypothetical protein
VLQRARRLGAHELDAVVVAQHANVVCTTPKGAELQGEITGTRDALSQSLQDACPQRVGECLRDPSLRCLPWWSVPGTG